jgi:hypothetical protein
LDTGIEEGSPGAPLNPCTLVSRAEAEAIVGGRIQGMVEAPLGPTCIYKLRSPKKDITLAVEAIDLAQARRQLRKPNAVRVRGRRAYCGRLGAPRLFATVARGHVLSVAAPCGIAQHFAAQALRRLAA